MPNGERIVEREDASLENPDDTRESDPLTWFYPLERRLRLSCSNAVRLVTEHIDTLMCVCE